MSLEIPQQENCCPEFHPEKWDGKSFSWNNKQFVKSRIWTFFYMPIGFGRVMKKTVQKMEAADVNSPSWLCLSDHTSPWNMNVYIDVDDPVKGLANCKLSGDYFCRIYEGPYLNTKKWCTDFEAEVASQGKKVKKWYMWYVYCPKCAKKFGKNYVGIIGELH